jgi:hypothetical protein
MKMSRNIIIGSVLVLVLFSTACLFPQVMSQDDAVATEVQKALGILAEKTEAAKAAATYTPYPTYTPQPTYTPEPSRKYYVPNFEPYRSNYYYGWNRQYCNRAEFLGENYPDYSRFDEGDHFTKTWVLRNTGRCTWTTDYKLVFTSGNSMSGDICIPLSEEVEPGEIVELSVDLTAPYRDGTYKGNWGIESDYGDVFANFWVLIRVR